MSKSFLFWLAYVLVFFFGWFWNASGRAATPYGWVGTNVAFAILFFLLGWQVFGFVIQ
jgi:hypothetical protein